MKTELPFMLIFYASVMCQNCQKTASNRTSVVIRAVGVL